MTIASLSDYYAAAKQRCLLVKSGNNQAQSTTWPSTGNPGAGSAPGNTANGLVPDNTTAGALPINPFSGTGYITRAEYACFDNGPPVRVRLYDRLFHAGAYAFNASVTLTAQPSYVARLPGSSYYGLEIWIEAVTTFTGVPAITVTYTDQDGNAGHTTGSWSAPTGYVGNPPIPASAWRLPLASGDSGVQMIESVACATASAGTFNVVVVRPLLQICANYGSNHSVGDGVKWLDQTHLPVVYPASCLFVIGNIASAANDDLTLEIAAR